MHSRSNYCWIIFLIDPLFNEILTSLSLGDDDQINFHPH